MTVRSSARSGFASISKQYSLRSRPALGKRSLIIGMNKLGRFTFNSATGGTETTVSNYNGTGETWKFHTFLTDGTLTVVSNSNPFTFALFGGGAGGGSGGFDGGGPHWGGQGGGGGFYTSSVNLLAGANLLTVGGGGGTSAYSGGTGGSTTFAGFSAGGGGGGAWGQDAITGYAGTSGIPSPAGNGGRGGGSNWSQTSPVTGNHAAWNLATNRGTGGSAGYHGGPSPSAGIAGAGVVAYRIN